MKFVSLISYPDRMIANLNANMLRGAGILVQVRSDDAGGVDPALALVNGVELLVPEDQLAMAQELLADDLET
ncbi:MAG TPA: DUF2007 domain-containing protein [Oligoflexus sp.]|uniref:putative signal transducing protein n=1 Tax=Oligoflexus sp. TaxID=1971216 RepID=UPI002D804003|nr:DUF2007 domain-containing protein [Oligoflexus sp.]HET9237355.1 DUF2007 domain-containing protein [Oligoflexus sp.]